jgi:chemotaxis protein CheX
MSNHIEQIDLLTREAVKEVFQSMLSIEVMAEAPIPLRPDPEGLIIGSVGFIGEATGITGIIYLYANVRYARVLTGRMLGISDDEVDNGDMMTDAVGELSNMVVGYVKSRLCDRGLACTLTIPSVVRGQELRVEGLAGLVRRQIGFRNCQDHVMAEVLLKESTE